MKAQSPPRLLGGLALCAALLPAIAAAQPAPLTPEIQVSSPQLSVQYLPSVAAEPDGDFVVAWTDWSDPNDRAIRVRRYTASGMAVTGALRVSQTGLPADFVGPSVAIHASGNFLVVWEGMEAAVLGRVFDAAGNPRTGEIEIHPSSAGGGLANPSLAATPEGFVVVWSGPVNGRKGIFARRYDSAGAPLGPELRVDTGTVELVQRPAIAANAAGGFIVVWEAVNDDPAIQRIRIAGRFFDAAGTPRSEELRLDERAQDFRSSFPSVAIASDGSFFVAWERNRVVSDMVGRLFGADGAPRGPAFTLNGPDPGQERVSRVAADPGGGFVAVWSFQGGSNFEPGPRGRRVDAAGHPRGPEFQLGHQRAFPSGVTVAFSSAGEFVAAWHGIFTGSPVGVFAQRFRFPDSTGADPCVVSEGRLACDTLRTGEPALEIPVDVRPGDVLLLGNLNGDTQDDPCFYRAGIFFCDLDHNGRAVDSAVRFGGAPADVPLLGDVNGDGRDDACVRRVRRFACDTAHNGGTAEVQVVFGLKTDLPLLGDVDGDGDDDPCLFRSGRFLCDTAHDGGAAEVSVAFGLAGDTPLLGDMDGDGREDFCVFRVDRFLCDTAHDGGAAEVEILFGEPGAIPLLGNVDGY